MDWILVLALGTFALLIVFLIWNRTSTKRHQQTGGDTAGIGGPNDPLSGAGADVRHPDHMRASLEEASANSSERAPSMHEDK